MKSAEAEAFYTLMEKTWAAYSKPLEPLTVTVWAEDLAGYELDEIEQALKDHRRDPARGRFLPTVADVMDKIQMDDGHPAPEEAWALCPVSEEDAAVWTDAIADAYFQTAAPMLERGETVSAARQAFLPAYKTALAKVRAHGQAPQFWVTPGSRKSTFQAVQKAYEAGWVSERWAAGYLELNLPEYNLRLPPPEPTAPRQGGGLQRLGAVPLLPARSAEHAG